MTTRWARYGLEILFLLIAGHAPAIAAGPRKSTEMNGLSAFDLFSIAARAEAEGRKHDAYTLYDALARDPSVDIRSEARFRKAALLEAERRYREAAVLLRAILDEAPKAARVRLELARMLALLGDEQAARRVLRQAEAAGLPPDVVATVQQFSRALRSTRRFGGSAEISFAPDTNVNRATDSRTLDTVIAPLQLSKDAMQRSGAGIKTSASLFARLPLSDKISLLPRMSAVASTYRDSGFNDMSGTALLGAEWRTGEDRLTPSLGSSWRRYGGKSYARTRTLTVDWLHHLGGVAQLLVNVSASRVKYRSNSLQNGSLYDLRISYERALAPSSGISLSIGSTRQTAADPGYATTSAGLSALGWKEIGGATLFLSVQGRRLKSDDRLFLFTDKRREWFVSGLAGATLRQLKVRGFAPVIRVGWDRNISTVGLYDYRRLFGEFGVARAF